VGEAADAEGDEKNCDCRKQVSEPGSVAGQGEDERDRHRWSGCRSDCGDGLSEGFGWREDVDAQA